MHRLTLMNKRDNRICFNWSINDPYENGQKIISEFILGEPTD